MVNHKNQAEDRFVSAVLDLARFPSPPKDITDDKKVQRYTERNCFWMLQTSTVTETIAVDKRPGTFKVTVINALHH